MSDMAKTEKVEEKKEPFIFKCEFPFEYEGKLFPEFPVYRVKGKHVKDFTTSSDGSHRYSKWAEVARIAVKQPIEFLYAMDSQDFVGITDYVSRYLAVSESIEITQANKRGPFIYKMKYPFTFPPKTGKMINTVTVQRMKGGDIRNFHTSATGVYPYSLLMKLLVKASGLPFSILEEFDTEDLVNCIDIISNFLAPSRQTG